MRKNKLSLTRADQLDIDLGQEFGIEQRAMFGAPRIIDGIAIAQIVQPVRRSGMLASRYQQRIDHAVAAHHLMPGALQFGIEEGQVEHCIVRNELRIAEKIYEFSHPARE